MLCEPSKEQKKAQCPGSLGEIYKGEISRGTILKITSGDIRWAMYYYKTLQNYFILILSRDPYIHEVHCIDK